MEQENSERGRDHEHVKSHHDEREEEQDTSDTDDEFTKPAEAIVLGGCISTSGAARKEIREGGFCSIILIRKIKKENLPWNSHALPPLFQLSILPLSIQRKSRLSLPTARIIHPIVRQRRPIRPGVHVSIPLLLIIPALVALMFLPLLLADLAPGQFLMVLAWLAE